MIDDGYAVVDDPYVYANSNILKNRAGIQDQETLDAFEIEMTSLAAGERFPTGKFNAKHFKAVHRHLFGGVYTWAGKVRTVRISKGGNTFCYPEYIEPQLEKLLGSASDFDGLKAMSREHYTSEMARLLAELNALHPFREGNGRTQLSFLALLSRKVGRPIDFSRLNRETYLPAVIASFTGNNSLLVSELSGMIEK